MTGAFSRKYSDDMRAAVAAAFETKTAAQVVALAAAGKLTDAEGVPLEAFELPESSVRSLARDQRRRQAGTRSSESSSLAAAAPRDAIETLRQKLVRASERGLAAIERYQDEHDGEPKSWEDLRQAIRCVREAANLPGPTDPRPVAPGGKPNGDGTRLPGDSETRGGVAGALLLAHRGGRLAPSPAPAGSVASGVPAVAAMPEPSAPRAEPEPDMGDPAVFARETVRTLAGATDGPQPGGHAPPASAERDAPRGRRDRDVVSRGMPDEDVADVTGYHEPRRRRAR